MLLHMLSDPRLYMNVLMASGLHLGMPSFLSWGRGILKSNSLDTYHLSDYRCQMSTYFQVDISVLNKIRDVR